MMRISEIVGLAGSMALCVSVLAAPAAFASERQATPSPLFPHLATPVSGPKPRVKKAPGQPATQPATQPAASTGSQPTPTAAPTPSATLQTGVRKPAGSSNNTSTVKRSTARTIQAPRSEIKSASGRKEKPGRIPALAVKTIATIIQARPDQGLATKATTKPSTAPVMGTAPAVAANPPPQQPQQTQQQPKPLAPSLIARINLTRQTMSVEINGRKIHRWRVSSGVTGFETPAGKFTPDWMSKLWLSRTYDNAPMPHAVFFKDGAAVHATTAKWLLGRPASHGCVRIAPSNAEAFYNLVKRHGLNRTRIIVSGKAPPVYVPGLNDRLTDRVADPRTTPRDTYSRYQPQLRAYTPAPASNTAWYYNEQGAGYAYTGNRRPPARH